MQNCSVRECDIKLKHQHLRIDGSEPKRQEYVLGFAFSSSLNKVALIEKNRVAVAFAGKWNGIGGKIKLGESPEQAMARESVEEMDLGNAEILQQWTPFAELSGLGFRVHCFYLVASSLSDLAGKTDERVLSFWTDKLPTNSLPSLVWLVQMATAHSIASKAGRPNPFLTIREKDASQNSLPVAAGPGLESQLKSELRAVKKAVIELEEKIRKITRT